MEELAISLNNEDLQLHTTGSNVYRLLPKHGLSEDGKRSIKSISTDQLVSADPKSHPDTSFSLATIGYLEELAAILGPREVTFHCQNNLYKVPIGLALPNTDQSPLLMHIEKGEIGRVDEENYLSLPAHKLILSVTGAMEIKENSFRHSQKSIVNSGPNYISIRKAELQPPTVLQRLRDMKLIRQVWQYKKKLRMNKGYSNILIFNQW